MAKEVFGEKYYDSREASKLLGVGLSTILRWCRDDKFGEKIGREYWIHEKNLMAKLPAAAREAAAAALSR